MGFLFKTILSLKITIHCKLSYTADLPFPTENLKVTIVKYLALVWPLEFSMNLKITNVKYIGYIFTKILKVAIVKYHALEWPFKSPLKI